MPFQRPRSGFFRGRSPRRQTAWEQGPGGSTATGLTGSNTQIVGSGIAALVDGLTVVRIRGSFEAILTSAVSALDGFHAVLGMCVVTNDAFAIGVTAVPNPMDDADWDGWMYHRFFDLHAKGATPSFLLENQTVIQFEVDTKAMRKLPLNETLLMSMQLIEVGAAGISVFFDSRMLVKLP